MQIQLDRFEGPLSLLLYLIKKNELDIYDIPIHEITQQYLEYIQIMKELNLEVAGEFIAMAATLIFIKSRMLVPQYDENGEVVEEDPRKELVQKLLEYQKYQEAGKLIYKRPLVGRDIWLRGAKEVMPAGEEEIIIDDKGLFGLISAFRQLIKDAIPTTHEVRAKGMSIASRLIEIKDRFQLGKRVELKEIVGESYTKVELIITFLVILELSRLGFTKIYQLGPANPLYIETVITVTPDIVTRVQEFDSVDAENTANKIMAEAQEELQASSMSMEAQAQIDAGALDMDKEIIAVEAGELT